MARERIIGCRMERGRRGWHSRVYDDGNNIEEGKQLMEFILASLMNLAKALFLATFVKKNIMEEKAGRCLGYVQI